MKKITSIFLSLFLATTLLHSCKDSKQGDATENAVQQTEPTSESDETKDVKPIGQILNANLATESELAEIGLTPELVSEIVESRPFLSMNAFDDLLGNITGKEELYKKVFVPLNLNTTAEEDFKMIPGVGDRMAHEFEEYRPYTSIRQFRREIGKYVDKAEVARYENYVFVPVELNTASEEDIKALPGVGDRMAHEFEEYRPYTNIEQFRKEIGKYVDDRELKRLERFVYLHD
jgi:DNA uptake protein ComE-like DNA-binding protein